MFKFERGMGLLTISWAAHPNLWRFPKMGDQQKCSIFGRFGCTPFRKSLYRRFFFHRILRSIGCGSQPILLGLALTTGGRKVLRGCLLGVINRHNHPLKESQDDEKTIYIYIYITPTTMVIHFQLELRKFGIAHHGVCCFNVSFETGPKDTKN